MASPGHSFLGFWDRCSQFGAEFQDLVQDLGYHLSQVQGESNDKGTSLIEYNLTLPNPTYFLQPTAYNLLPTTYYLQTTTYNLLPTTYCLAPKAYHLQPTTHNLPPTTYNVLPTSYHLQPTSYHLLTTTFHLQPTKMFIL